MSDNQQPTTSDQEPTTDQRSTNQPMLVSVKDAAVRLGISENAVRLRIKRNTLPAEKIGDNWFVVVADQSATNQATTNDQSQPTTTHESGPTTSDESPTDQSVVVAERIRIELETIRDEWLQPLIDQIRELERDRGRLEAENVISQQRAKELEQERDELRRRVEDQIAAMDDDDEGPISIAEAESVRELERERDALQSRVRELEQRQVESPQPVQTTSQGRPQRTQKPRQRRWWLRLFGIDE